ncbi:MAG: hypothetical protein DRG78_02635 [Epsilonproteobacteria bacterium]|nr:MAG: hypothetical protein DRG78_02635 [Campylobacterota bacterium]
MFRLNTKSIVVTLILWTILYTNFNMVFFENANLDLLVQAALFIISYLGIATMIFVYTLRETAIMIKYKYQDKLTGYSIDEIVQVILIILHDKELYLHSFTVGDNYIEKIYIELETNFSA